MNNFVFSQDPLLFSSTMPPMNAYSQNDVDIKKQLDNVVNLYNQHLNQMQTPPHTPPQHDYIGELDEILRNLDPVILDNLNKNDEFVSLNTKIQQTIQAEIINNIKDKLNNDNDMINMVSRTKDIITEIKNIQEQEDRKSLSELNDYITNYSDMTFNEYKALKQKK